MDLFGFGLLSCALAFFTLILKTGFKPQFGFKAVKNKKPQTQETHQVFVFFFLSEFI